MTRVAPFVKTISGCRFRDVNDIIRCSPGTMASAVLVSWCLASAARRTDHHEARCACSPVARSRDPTLYRGLRRELLACESRHRFLSLSHLSNRSRPREAVPLKVEAEGDGPPPGACHMVGVGRPSRHPKRNGTVNMKKYQT